VPPAPRIRAVSFDLFDTLVDLEWAPPIAVAGLQLGPSTPALHAELGDESVALADFAAALRQVDRAIRLERYVEGREVSTKERFEALLRALGRECEATLVERLRAVHMGRLRSQVRELPHHPAVLAALRGRLPLGVCSNFTDSRTALRVLDDSRLAPHLDAVAISESVGWRKPRAEIFEALVGALGVPADALLHVGDNLEADVAGAAALGLRTAWLTRRVPDPAAARARYSGPPPDFELADLADLPALLDAEGMAAR
jgi:putative hydrolase of the HAD superfamily